MVQKVLWDKSLQQQQQTANNAITSPLPGGGGGGVAAQSGSLDGIRHKYDIFFSRAQWRITENDGQLGIAGVSIGNFSYAKTVMKDDSTEHLLEMGHIAVKNLLKNQSYADALVPTELRRDVPLDRRRALRIFCREKAPVGGISVKEHFEVNVVPLTLGITQQFYKKMIAFCFPEKSEDSIKR